MDEYPASGNTPHRLEHPTMLTPPGKDLPEDRVTRWEQEYGPQIRVTLRARGVRENDVDDVKQEAWLKAWLAAQRGEIPPQKEEERRWLTTVAINTAIDRHRKRNLQDRHLAHLIQSGKVRRASDQVAETERIRTTKAITAALESLDPSSRQLVEWHFLEGIPIAAIARKLHRHRNTIHAWISKALKNLRTSREIEDLEGGSP
jgi:RNA polymerase sigma factor (sigma-70 family)